jgi:hypothetical protein
MTSKEEGINSPVKYLSPDKMKEKKGKKSVFTRREEDADVARMLPISITATRDAKIRHFSDSFA